MPLGNSTTLCPSAISGCYYWNSCHSCFPQVYPEWSRQSAEWLHLIVSLCTMATSYDFYFERKETKWEELHKHTKAIEGFHMAYKAWPFHLALCFLWSPSRWSNCVYSRVSRNRKAEKDRQMAEILRLITNHKTLIASAVLIVISHSIGI